MSGRLERYRRHYSVSEETERIVFFSDAVFAIAMTLLVLEIKVPELSANQVGAGELAHALAEQWPHVFGYVLSFLFIAITWISHHNIWKFITRSNTRLLWLNIAQLMFVAFMPVPTALIAQYGPTTRIAPIGYALTAAVLGLLATAVWAYAYRTGLTDDRVEPDMYVMVRRHLLLSPVVLLTSCLIAIVSPIVAMLSWTATWPVAQLSHRQMAGWLRRRDAEDAEDAAAGPAREPAS